ncbi:isochorismatase [Coniochaeta sp. PMI_546]|nr:isochorismatase [Coniochaeta sp. PMI_546]
MAPDLTFGPPGEEWHYDRKTKTYDLTRNHARPAYKLRTTQGPGETSITISPSITALVVVDMQNFFLHPKCRDHPLGLAAVEPTLKVIARCRQLGIQIIWLNWGLTPSDLRTIPASVQRGFARSLVTSEPDPSGAVRAGLGADLGPDQGRCLCKGEWNSAVYGALADEVRTESGGDAWCDKNRMSGLWSEAQPLWGELTEGGKRTLLFAGVNTDQCVLGTLTDAYNAGWDCVLLEDCCATTTPGAKEVCLYNIAGSYGFVTDSEMFVTGEVVSR